MEHGREKEIEEEKRRFNKGPNRTGSKLNEKGPEAMLSLSVAAVCLLRGSGFGTVVGSTADAEI